MKKDCEQWIRGGKYIYYPFIISVIHPFAFGL